MEIDIEKINENEIFKTGKLFNLIINCFSSIDDIFKDDDDIWIFSLDSLDEIGKNKNIMYNVKGPKDIWILFKNF